MSVCTQHGRDPSIQIPAQCHLLGSGFSMKIHNNDLTFDGRNQRVSFAERIISILHENAALEINHGKALALRQSAFIQADAGNTFSIVRWPQHFPGTAARISIRRIKVIQNLALIPDVISRGEHMAAEVKQLLGNSRGNSEAAGRVLSIGNDQIHLIRLYKMRKMIAHDLAPWAAEDVANEENLHEHLI